MIIDSPTSRRDIAGQLYRNGYVLLPEWRREDTTIVVGQSIGSVVDIHALLPRSNIPTVQTLKPQHESVSSTNLYSGTYGFNEFPLHTDLAHWAQPPRYFILRCQNGSRAVSTRLLAGSSLVSELDIAVLRRALVRPRCADQNGVICLLPLLFCVDDICGFRWDSLFLVPMNEEAKRVADIMSFHAAHCSKSLTLNKPGDTLIIDNWRFLHGRSKIPMAGINRRLERVYLSEIYR